MPSRRIVKNEVDSFIVVMMLIAVFVRNHEKITNVVHYGNHVTISVYKGGES